MSGLQKNHKYQNINLKPYNHNKSAKKPSIFKPFPIILLKIIDNRQIIKLILCTVKWHFF